VNTNEVLLAVVYEKDKRTQADLYMSSSEKILFEFDFSLANIVYDSESKDNRAQIKTLNKYGGVYFVNAYAESSKTTTWFKRSFKAPWTRIQLAKDNSLISNVRPYVKKFF
jgi:hypothetical protein